MNLHPRIHNPMCVFPKLISKTGLFYYSLIVIMSFTSEENTNVQAVNYISQIFWLSSVSQYYRLQVCVMSGLIMCATVCVAAESHQLAYSS